MVADIGSCCIDAAIKQSGPVGEVAKHNFSGPAIVKWDSPHLGPFVLQIEATEEQFKSI